MRVEDTSHPPAGGALPAPATMSRLTRFLRSVSAPHDSLRDHCLLPLQQPNFPVAVCWSAKSGCTTVLKWFLAHTQLLDEALAYSSWVHDYRQHKLFQANGYRQQCERLFRHGTSHTFVVKVIRDPATRAVSSFLHFLRCSRDVRHWSVETDVRRWKSAAGIAHQPGLSFRQFLLFVTAQQLNRARLDPHFRPQHDVRQDARVDAFIRLEDLADALRVIEHRTGLPHIDVRELSQSTHHNPVTTGHGWPTLASEYPADHNTLDELGTPPTHVFLEPATRMLMRTAYWADYAAYGHLYDAAPATLPLSRHVADWRDSAETPRPSLRQAA